MPRVEVLTKPSPHLIPDFCRGRAILTLAFLIELVAILLTLAGGIGREDLGLHFVLLSLFLQWLGLCSAAVLCLSRRWLAVAPAGLVFAAAWGLLLLVTLVLSDVAYYVAQQVQWRPAMTEGTRGEFVLRNLCISAIVSLFLLRLFWVQNQWREQVRAEADARYEALQARIRPHFLFNSLNSIAALISSAPERAEQLIEDLSELFRVSLDVRSRLVPLQDELEITRAYLRIEQVRLGERLQLEWDIPDELLAVEVPLLSVQPLAENAVYHGIARLPGGGCITLRGNRLDGHILLDVENPLPADTAPTAQGLRMAVDNIAQRLALIYGEHASIELGEDAGRFRARLRLPVTVPAREAL